MSDTTDALSSGYLEPGQGYSVHLDRPIPESTVSQMIRYLSDLDEDFLEVEDPLGAGVEQPRYRGS